MKSAKFIFSAILLALFLLSLLVSCDEKNIDASLLGKWQLKERLADPGDGSGTFQPVSSDKTITLFSDSTFTSNENMCFMSVNSGSPSSGTFSLKDKTITPNNCTSSPFTIRFELIAETNELIVHYPCIEACAEKFKKIENLND